MEADTVTIRSDSYATNFAKYFLSKNTAVAVSNYVQLKMAKGESIGVMLVCQMVGRHESDHPSDQIQSTQYLPEHATRLDTQMSTASNVEELFINATKLDRNRGFSSRDNSPF